MDLDIDAALIESVLDRETVSTVQEAKWEELVREVVPLAQEDLAALELVGPSRSQSGLQHIRAFHHAIALRLAAGERPVDICAVLSVTPQTITRLGKDVQFQELVELYREETVKKVVDHFELMGIVATETLTAMHEKLTNEEERPMIGFESLRRTAETLVDRIGHSPIRRSETLNRVQHDLTDDSINRIRQLHAEDTAYEAKILKEGPVETSPPDKEGGGLVISLSDGFKSLAEEPVEGNESEGPSV